ncbi:MAG: cobalt-precorrin-5B (C(1))-methyltransferase [Alphaproteobacteria bacterium GM7ARS4]|nr:cobalt-precorrin-5B (C(1))-methyltransferase [Alphaproteobacteria bacterium GM7ARS4]
MRTLGNTSLRHGWTTGSCATAALQASYRLLMEDEACRTTRILLPRPVHDDKEATFAIESSGIDVKGNKREAWACVMKDSGDDPDVTHGALVKVSLTYDWDDTMMDGDNCRVLFHGGEGVGMVTKAGLPLAVGEAAINPVPRAMMTSFLRAQRGGEAQRMKGGRWTWHVTIHVEDGARLAQKTWNGRLGIEGGLSILGTRGIVVPYSCSAWIHAIHRGIDVAVAQNYHHIAAATGRTSESVLRERYHFPMDAIIDMGDFVGGMVNYMRGKPIRKLTLCGGFGKLSKLAVGARDLHVRRSRVDMDFLRQCMREIKGERDIGSRHREASSALALWEEAHAQGVALGDRVAWEAARMLSLWLKESAMREVHVMAIDRLGSVIGEGVYGV